MILAYEANVGALRNDELIHLQWYLFCILFALVKKAAASKVGV